jgi:hypothetical protein
MKYATCLPSLKGLCNGRQARKIQKELETLFQFVPPKKLKKSILFMFLRYISNTPVGALPQNFNEISEDTQFLIEFLDKVQKNKKQGV